MQLNSFNNLTKALRLNLYFMFATPAALHQSLDQGFHAAALEELLRTIADRIDAAVLSCSKQDYQPWGASALMLLSDIGPSVQMHLNKSHLCVHTYPDADPVCPSLRVDLDLASCGMISPLRCLGLVLDRLRPAGALIDYTIRGFTREATGALLFQDHALPSLHKELPTSLLDFYTMIESSCGIDQTWQMKLLEKGGHPELRRILQLPSSC